jgi:hypothetical protein
VGVNVVVYYKGLKFVNFDSDLDDNDINTNKNEQNYLHAQVFGGDITNFTIADTTTVWIVKKLDNHTLRGIACGDPKKLGNIISNIANTVVIDEISGIDRTISHEIGHAKFHLFHPDVVIPGCGGSGWSWNKLTNQTGNDKKNFMNSGCTHAIHNTSINDFIIRKYQWTLIHSKL